MYFFTCQFFLPFKACLYINYVNLCIFFVPDVIWDYVISSNFAIVQRRFALKLNATDLQSMGPQRAQHNWATKHTHHNGSVGKCFWIHHKEKLPSCWLASCPLFLSHSQTPRVWALLFINQEDYHNSLKDNYFVGCFFKLLNNLTLGETKSNPFRKLVYWALVLLGLRNSTLLESGYIRISCVVQFHVSDYL